MAKFGYTSRRKMDPVPGRKFSTEYYKQSHRERQRTQQHVDGLLKQFGEEALADPEALDAITAPMKKYPRKETNGYYSALDIMGDLSTQMNLGKDIPYAMLSRWNRLFAGTGHEIDMVPEADLPSPNNYNNFFGSDQ